MSNKKAPGLSGFLGKGTRFEGELSFPDRLRIEGQFKGRIHSPDASLSIVEGASVEGEIEIAELFLSGSVRGTIVAHRRLEVSPTGQVQGEVYSGNLVVRDGAIIDGVCHMDLPPEHEARQKEKGKQAGKAPPTTHPDKDASNNSSKDSPSLDRRDAREGGKHDGHAKKDKKSNGNRHDSAAPQREKGGSPVWRRSGWDPNQTEKQRQASHSKKA